MRGATRFAADLPVHGLLHARLVVAHEAHARITAIRTDAALAAPGVVGVLTAADLPIVATGLGRQHEPLARRGGRLRRPAGRDRRRPQRDARRGRRGAGRGRARAAAAGDRPRGRRPPGFPARARLRAGRRRRLGHRRCPRLGRRWRRRRGRGALGKRALHGEARAGQRRCRAGRKSHGRARQVHDAVDVSGIHRAADGDRVARARR